MRLNACEDFRYRVKKWFRRRIAEREKELKRIESISRFTKDNTPLLGRSIEFVDSASFVSMFRQIFELEIYAFEPSTDRPYIIDGGSNIGLSVIYFKRRYPGSLVVAVEADPSVFDVLQKNIRVCGFQDVTFRQRALWDTKTEIDFWAQGADAGRAAEDFVDSSHPDERYCVKTDVLSDYLDRTVDLLKLDIEGAEWRVLNECKKKLTKVNNIFVEYHSFSNTEQKVGDLLAILRKAGFRVQIQHERRETQPFISRGGGRPMDMQLNIFGYRP